MGYIAFAFLAILGFVGLLYVRVYFCARRQRKENEEAILLAKTYAADFTTPEGAILVLENAFRRKDLEAAVACKDFVTEARLILQKMGFGPETDDDTLLKAAEVLELSFRRHTCEVWPLFVAVRSFFVAREPYQDSVIAVTEICRFPHGETSRQQVLTTETPNGWRVLNTL